MLSIIALVKKADLSFAVPISDPLHRSQGNLLADWFTASDTLSTMHRRRQPNLGTVSNSNHIATSDVPSLITLADGSLLIIQKIGGVGRGPLHYVAKRQVGDKIVDEKPTGSFKGKNGQIILLDQGKVLQPLRLEQAR